MAKEKKVYIIISEPNPAKPDENIVHAELFNLSDFSEPLIWSKYGSMIPDNIQVTLRNANQINNTAILDIKCPIAPSNNASRLISMDESRAQKLDVTLRVNGRVQTASMICGVTELSQDPAKKRSEIIELASRLCNFKFGAPSENIQEDNFKILTEALTELDKNETEETAELESKE